MTKFMLCSALILLHLSNANAQSWLWANSASSTGQDFAKDIAVDLTNNRLFSVGTFRETLTNVPGSPSPLVPGIANGLILTTDTGGVYINHARIFSNQDVSLEGATLDGSGNLYVCGSFIDSADFAGNGAVPMIRYSIGKERFFVAKYDPGLNGIWAITDTASSASIAHDIDFGSGQVVVGGSFFGALELDSVRLVSSGLLDGFAMAIQPATGLAKWAMGIEGSLDEEVLSVRVGYFAVFAGGYFGSASIAPTNGGWNLANAGAGTTDAFVAAFRVDSGFVRWANQAGGIGQDTCHGLSVDFTQAYASGSFTGTAIFNSLGPVNSAGGNDAFIWAMARGSGNGNWVRREGGLGDDAGLDVAADRIGNIYTAGRFGATLSFGGSFPLTPTGSGSSFVCRHLADGSFDGWATMASNNDHSEPSEIVSGPSGTYISGEYKASALNFLGSSLPALPPAPEENYFTAKIGCGNLLASLPTFTLSKDSICSGDTVSLSISSSVPGLYYGMQDMYSTFVLPDIQAGTGGPLNLQIGPLTSAIAIDVFVMDSVTKCYDVISTNNVILMGPPALPNLGPDLGLCIGDSIVLNPGTFFKTSWQNADTSPTFTVHTSGTYFVDVTTIFGCQGADTVQLYFVPKPSNFVRDTSSCPGISLNHSATGPYAFLWSTGAMGIAVTLPDTGSYWCQATDSGCTVTVPFAVLALPVPSFDLGPDTSFCQGDSVELRVNTSGISDVLWSTGDTSARIYVSSTASLFATATNSAGCQFMDSILVTLNPAPLVSLGVIPQNFCETDSAISFVPSPAGGTLGGILSTPLLDPASLGPGAFFVSYTYRDSLGCENSVSLNFTVDAMPSLASAGPDQTLLGQDNTQLGGNAPSSGIAMWTALGSGILSDSSLSAPLVTAIPPGTHTFVYTISAITCPSSTDTMRITVVPLLALEIPTGFSPNGDGINDIWVIPNLNAYPTRSVNIFTRWGTRVFSAEAYNNNFGGLDHNGDALGDDAYFFTLDLGDRGAKSGYIVLKR